MLTLFLVNGCIAALAVMIHYEFLYQLTAILPKLQLRYRFRILLGVFTALIAHSLEVWLFGLAYYLMHNAANWGSLQGNTDGSLMDCVYFSFTVYTTVGFGDIEPMGDLRFLTGVESLTGLVLITWTASLLYLEMRRYWNRL